MALNLEHKQAIVAEVNEAATNALAAVLSDYRGLTVLQMTEMRVKARETVWAERFDAPLEQVFDIQDEISATVAGRLAVHVDEATLESARQRSVEHLPAYECWLRGMDCLKRGTLEGDEESRPLFEQAVQINPQYARAYAGLSLSHFNEWTCHAWHLWDENESNAFDYATKAAELDDREPIVQSVLARVCRFRHGHGQHTVVEFRRDVVNLDAFRERERT